MSVIDRPNSRTLRAKLSQLSVAHDRLTRELAKLTATVNASDQMLLHAAAEGDVAIVRSALANGANPNVRDEEGNTPLLLAVYREAHVAVVRTLLQGGADPNQPAMDGTTPLIQSVVDSQILNVRELIKYGADVNARNADGDSPLTNAAAWGSAKIVPVLLEAGANRRRADGAGYSAAQLARAQSHHAIADLLEMPQKRRVKPRRRSEVRRT